VTPKSLEAAALFYLQRYSASAERVRRVLRRRITRARLAGQPDLDAETTAGWIEAIVGKLQMVGLLDDARHAETRAVSLARRGESQTLIARRLRAEGIDAAIITTCLESLAEDTPGPAPDRIAAATLARRRRLGPYRNDPDERAARRERDLAALARKGFSARLARSVIDAPDIESLEDWIHADDDFPNGG